MVAEVSMNIISSTWLLGNKEYKQYIRKTRTNGSRVESLERAVRRLCA